MIITRTPFRISFLGGGTDYPIWYREHGGAVLSTSINKYCYITTRYLPPVFPYKYRIRYTHQEHVGAVSDIRHPSVRECLSFLNFHDRGIEMQHNADLPAMSGLGSSSAFTVGFLQALYGLRGESVSKKQLALDAIRVEQERIGEQVGSQDQTAAAYGGFNRIEFGGPQEISVHPVTLAPETQQELERHLTLFFVGYPRVASQVLTEQIQNTPYRVRELTTLHQMVDEALSILTQPSPRLHDFGKLLHEGWLLKQSLSSKITNGAINEIYNQARAAGAIGGKLLGAGGGGFLLLFVPPERQAALKEKLKRSPCIPFRFERSGSQVIYQLPDEVEEYVWDAGFS